MYFWSSWMIANNSKVVCWQHWQWRFWQWLWDDDTSYRYSSKFFKTELYYLLTSCMYLRELGHMLWRTDNRLFLLTWRYARLHNTTQLCLAMPKTQGPLKDSRMWEMICWGLRRRAAGQQTASNSIASVCFFLAYSGIVYCVGFTALPSLGGGCSWRLCSIMLFNFWDMLEVRQN